MGVKDTAFLEKKESGLLSGGGFGISYLSRWLFGLDENTALLWVWLPIFIAFIPFCIFILPKHLRKAGIL